MIGGALDDLVVLDFGQLIAGPVCGMWLADMGATVIKLEPPDGELGRRLGPPWLNGESLTALTSNRNKLGLCVDLKHPDARDAVARMARRADVVLENFRPGVMRRLGLDYETLRPANPALIYCAISAYGGDTPWRARPGVDGILQAATGLMSGIGADTGEPGKAPLPLADMTAAMFATMGILAALRRRDRDGAGVFLDLSLYSGMLMLQQLNVASFLASGQQPRHGSAAPYAAPNEAFETADGWIMIAAYQDKRWAALCRTLDREALLHDPRFATCEARVANRPAMHDALDASLRARPTAHWCALFAEADILAAPVASFGDVVGTEQYAASGIEVSIDHAVAGRFAMPGFAVGAPAIPPRSPPPRKGEHSRQVLVRLGFSDAEIDGLVASGAVITEEVA